MPVKIERNVPMPEKNLGATKYPWGDLKVGDSFVVQNGTNGRQLCIQATMTRTPKRFESRIVKGVCRVWRVA